MLGHGQPPSGGHFWEGLEGGVKFYFSGGSSLITTLLPPKGRALL